MSRHAFILAGGLGRRLAPLTAVIPKPLVPVGNQSVLELLLRQLAGQGITDVTVSLGYLGHLIEAVVGDGQRYGVRCRYVTEDEPLGTAGALGMLEVEPDDDVLVINGDTFTDLRFDEIIAGHAAAGAAATIAAHRRTVSIDFGVLQVEDERLVGYDEKPNFEFLVSMGVNVLSGRVVRELRPLRRLDMPELLTGLRERGELVRCVEADCLWLDLGRVDDVLAANELVEADPSRFIGG